MQPGRRQRTFLLGAAASLVLHGLAAVLILRALAGAPPTALPKVAPAVEVRLIEVTRPPPAQLPAIAPSNPLKRSPARTAHRTPPAHARPAPAATPAVPAVAAAAPAASPTKESGQAGAGPAPWTEAWLRAEGLQSKGEKPPPGVALSDEQLSKALGVPLAKPDELPRAELIVPESREAETKRVTGRIQGFGNSYKAFARAEFPDVYWRNLRDRLAKGFQVPYEVYAGGHGGESLGGAREMLAKVADQHLHDAAAYGKGGNPFSGDPLGPGAPRSLAADTAAQGIELRGIPGAAMAQEMFMRQATTAAGSALTARVLVSQGEDGRVADVALVGPSGNTAYDRLALKQARSLIGDELTQLGPLPPEGRRSLWAFSTDFHVLPPVPGFGCALDAYFIPRDCTTPFKKQSNSRVRLEAIY